MKIVLAALVVVAAVLGLAGGSLLLLDHRLAGLTAGAVEVGFMYYNPLNGRLILENVRARDAAGRDVFRADSIVGTASPLSILGGSLSLGRVRVVAPRVTLTTDAGVHLDTLAAGFGAAHAFLGGTAGGGLPLSVDDLLVAGGAITIEGAGEGGAPLQIRDLDVRLSRLTTAGADQRDMAFAVEMGVYGTLVYLTGQPRGDGYVVHVRARGLDAAAVLRDLSMATLTGPAAALAGFERGQAEVDVDVLLAGGRAFASGYVKLADAVATLPVAGTPRLRAAAAFVAVEGFDVAAGTGRVTRIDLTEPSLTLSVTDAQEALAALAESLGSHPGALVRRIAVTDGTLILEGPDALRLDRLQLAVHVLERQTDAPWSVSMRAALGGDAQVSVDGIVTRDVRTLDAVTRLQRVPLASWPGLAGGWDGRVSFDGRLRLVASEGEVTATATGQAQLDEVTASTAGGFSVDRVALTIRRLRWPLSEALLDNVVLTRPAFGPAALRAWPLSVLTNGMSVIDGDMRGEAGRRALHRVTLDVVPDGARSGARLQLSATTDAGPINVERVVPSADPFAVLGVPVSVVAAAVDDAARVPIPAALPAAVAPY